MDATNKRTCSTRSLVGHMAMACACGVHFTSDAWQTIYEMFSLPSQLNMTPEHISMSANEQVQHVSLDGIQII